MNIAIESFKGFSAKIDISAWCLAGINLRKCILPFKTISLYTKHDLYK